MILENTRFHQDGSLPDNGEVFVFGSNTAGIHGKGSAKVAVSLYGARYRVGEGLHGNSYAIPTKGLHIETLRLTEIRYYVERFVRFSLCHPKLKFFVTSIGCGLAGYTPEQIAPMFSDCGDNCNFLHTWYTYV